MYINKTERQLINGRFNIYSFFVHFMMKCTFGGLHYLFSVIIHKVRIYFITNRITIKISSCKSRSTATHKWI